MKTRLRSLRESIIFLSVAGLVAVLLTGCLPSGPAPDFQGIEGWINSEPLTLQELHGKVVLVDFWTYSCVNCIRTFPYLKEWHRKYSGYGLVIVGVHTPEFEFEKVRDNVEKAVAAYGLEYPIAQDNGYLTWSAYANNVWPAKYLIDREGNIRYTHFGEGAYSETEKAIRQFLEESGFPLGDEPMVSLPEPRYDPDAFGADPGRGLTRELYAGYDRNPSLPASSATTLFGPIPAYIMHPEYYEQQDTSIFYQDPGDHLSNFIYLQGPWHNGREKVTHARTTPEHEDHIATRFYANSANAVMEGDGQQLSRVRITLDGAPVGRDIAGEDVRFSVDGDSYVLVGPARLYRLVEKPNFSGHELRLSPLDKGVSLYTFTFGAYPEGP